MFAPVNSANGGMRYVFPPYPFATPSLRGSRKRPRPGAPPSRRQVLGRWLIRETSFPSKVARAHGCRQDAGAPRGLPV